LQDLGQHEDLKRIALFDELGAAELESLSQFIILHTFAKAQIIYQADKSGEDCFLILKGRVKLCLGLEDGREISFEILGPGDFFGEGVLLEPPLHNCAAQAIERSELLLLPRRQLLELMENNGRFSLYMARHLAGRLHEFRQRQEMLLHSVNVRFARLLLSLAKRHGTLISGPGVRLNVKLTHQEMANLIGTARETLTVTIGKFRQEGILTENRHNLVIKNMPELERRAWPVSEAVPKI